jgi:O-antigen/teichoic acid export membrane protein
MGFLKTAVSGAYWTSALRMSLRALTLIRTVILARLLSPFQLGVYGVASLSLALLEILTETGINIFLIQEKNLEEHIHTAWIVSIARGVIIATILVLASQPVSIFFRSPESRYLILLISLVASIRGFINPAVVTFQKNLNFRQEFKFRSLLFTIEATVTVVIAFITRSSASLIYGLMASSICEVAFSFMFIRPVPKFIFEFSRLKNVLHRGKWITLAGIFEYLFKNLDNIVVGRVLGVGPLGLYDTAYKISSLPITELSDVFAKVTLPIYAQIKTDTVRLRRAFTYSILSLALLVIPICIFFLIFPQIIVIVLGPNWSPAIPALQLLSICGAIRAISGYVPALLLALNKAKLVTYISFFTLLGLAVSIIPMVSNWGIEGAAGSAIIGSVVSLPIIIACLRQVFNHDIQPSNR